MKFYLSLFLSLFFSFAYGQSTKIEGTIIADTASLSLGQITIFSLPDSTLKKGSYLDSTYFSLFLETKGQSDFYAKISIPNYLDTIIAFTINNPVINLGIITPIKNKNLETVEFVYRKEMFKRTMDGISVNVEGTNLQTLSTLFDVLKASPKILSPDDERIEIIGRGSPLIMVDRQAIISNDELKAIPASQIEKIEIITNPSAKYKAQGSGNGVIEVYTKNFHLEGYNMTVRASAGVSTQLKPTGGLNLGLSMKKKKFALNGYFGGNYNSSNGFGTSSGYTTDNSNRKLNNVYDYNRENIWQYYSIKGAYSISEKQKFSLGINGYGGSGGNTNTATSAYLQEDAVVSLTEKTSSTEWAWLNNSAFMNYSIETDTNKSNFEINLNYVNKVSNSDDFSATDFEDVGSGQKSNFTIRNDSKDIPNIWELRSSYEHVFDTTGWKLSGGLSYSILFNNKTFDQYNLVDDEWIVDPVFSNSYDYKEFIGAVFVEVTKKWKKLGIRTGLRAEQTKLDGYSNSLNKQFMDSSYVLPFPSASVMYEFNPKFVATLFYDSGIDRPQFSNYDPFVIQEDSLNIQYGNPFLRPAIEQTIGIDIDLFYAYNISFSYTHLKDPTNSLSFIKESGFVTETTPWNARAEEGISASLSLPFQKPWLRGWNSLWIDYSKYTFTPEFGREAFYNLTFGFYSYLTFILPKNFEIMNSINLSKWGSFDFQSNTRVNWGLRLTKKMKGNKFQIFASVNNIVPSKSITTTYSGNFVFDRNAQDRFTSFKLGLFWKFGRLKAAAQIKESTSGQSDRL